MYESEVLPVEDAVALTQHFLAHDSQVEVRSHVAHVKQLLVVLLEEEWCDGVVAGEAEGTWPPHHCLIDVNAPGENNITEEDGVCCSLKAHVVVILAEWGCCYRLAM